MDRRSHRCPFARARASGHRRDPTRAPGRRIALAVLALGATLPLATGSAMAQGAETEPKTSGSSAETRVRDAAQGAQTASGRRARRERQQQKRRDWWIHAREVLFADLELDAAQARAVDAIVETQLRNRARFQELDTQYAEALRRADKERTTALDAELRAVNAELKQHHAIFEEMRELLRQEQRPTFDTNRARLVAEGQAARRAQQEGRGAVQPQRRINPRRSPSS